MQIPQGVVIFGQTSGRLLVCCIGAAHVIIYSTPYLGLFNKQVKNASGDRNNSSKRIRSEEAKLGGLRKNVPTFFCISNDVRHAQSL